MDHFTSPRNTGPMDAPDLTGHAGAPGRGPFLILYLGIDRERVARAGDPTYGRGATVASGSMLTELIAGKTFTECLDWTPERFIEALDPEAACFVADPEPDWTPERFIEARDRLPPDKIHGPLRAIAALRDALKACGPTRFPLGRLDSGRMAGRRPGRAR